MAALRSSRCLKGDSGAGLGMSLTRMKSRKPIIPAPKSAPNTKLSSNFLFQPVRVFFNRVAIAGERGVVHQGPASGHCGLQRMMAADAAQDEENRDRAYAQRDVGHQPEVRVRVVPEDLLAVLGDESGDDLRVAHAARLHPEDLRACRLAEVALAGGHHAVEVLVAGAALAG